MGYRGGALQRDGAREANGLLSPATDELPTYALHHSCELAQLLDITIVEEYNLLQ